MKKYTAPLSLTTLVCFMGTLQSIAVTLVMEHKPSAWAVGFDMNLLAAAYAVCFLIRLRVLHNSVTVHYNNTVNYMGFF